MHIEGVLRVSEPRAAKAVPLLVDSPHSGRIYPDDFGFACPIEALQRYEDRFVDLLLSNVTKYGATLVQAEMPRTYIDLNRAIDDLSPKQLADAWTGPFRLKPSVNAARGTGLIWTQAWDAPIYKALPESAAILGRIDTYYRPYYAAMNDAQADIKARFGRVWHLNVHSMPPHINGGQSDIVLGDLDGRSCSPAFLNVIAGAFTAHGLRVTFNDPYKGAELTRKFGQPHKQAETLQIEINKACYLQDDLITLDRPKFLKMQRILEAVIKTAADFAAGQLSNTAAKASLRAASSASMDTFLPSAASDVTP